MPQVFWRRLKLYVLCIWFNVCLPIEMIHKAQVIPELMALTVGNPSLREGSLSNALEEYVEAKCFNHYIQHHNLLPLRELSSVNKNEYIGGIIDFTGSL